MNAKRWVLILATTSAALGCHRGSAPPSPAPSFSAPVLASDVPEYGASEPSIVAGARGHLVVGFIDWTPPRPRIRITTSSNGGASFAPSRLARADDPAHGDGQADVSLVWTRDGRVFMSFLACRHDEDAPTGSACDVEAAVSRDDGASFQPLPPVAEGGNAHRERDWLATDGTRVFASWTENLTSGADWVVAALGTDGAFHERTRLHGRASLSGPIDVRAPSAAKPEGELDALLMDRPSPKPGSVVLDRRRSRDGGEHWDSQGTVTFDRASALLPYSQGMLGGMSDGGAWIAIPRGDGTSNDFVLAHRPAGLDVFRTAPTLRAKPDARVGMPWFGALEGGHALAAWLEEHDGAWNVYARTLVDARHRSLAAVVQPRGFHFQEASLKENIGDYLTVATGDGQAWICWSDTTGGRAQIHVAKAISGF